MLSIGLDIGTTGLCGLLTDCESGEVLKVVNRPNTFFIKTEKDFEYIQDAKLIYAEVSELLDGLFDPGVGAVGVTGQMHGIVYLDSDGRLLSPLYTWQDRRGDLMYGAKTYSGQLGAPSGYGLTTDFYNEVNGLVPPDAAVICTIHDYVAMRLAGLKSPLVHASDAASLGRYDCEKGDFNLYNPRLPRVTKTARVIGEYRGAAVCTAIGDNQASFFGSVKGDAALINVGTGSQVSIPISGYTTVAGLETRPLDSDRYILVGSSLCGGRAFALLERFFASVVEMAGGRSESLYKNIDALLESGGGTSLKFDTRFCGTRSEPGIRASVTNLSDTNFTARDFAAGVIAGIADELYGFYEKSGRQVTELVGSGNGIRKNAALKRALEQRFGCEMTVPAQLEEAACGAAYIAARATLSR